MVDQQQQDKEIKDIEEVLNNNVLLIRKYLYRNVEVVPVDVKINIYDCSESPKRLIQVHKINGGKVLLVYYFTNETHIYLVVKEESEYELLKILPDYLRLPATAC